MIVAAVCNQKGGVGKTTLTINLGAALADLGKRVLILDLDPQGHLTEGVGMQELYLEETPGLYEGLLDRKDAGSPLIVRHHPKEHFDVLPSNYRMMLAEQALFMARNREHRLKNLLPLIGEYDWVLMDCPPALGMLTDNALNAARQVIIPIQAEATSIRALDLLFDQIESIERGLRIHVEVLAVVPNLVQDSSLSRGILAKLRASIPTVTPFDIRKRVVLQEAWIKGSSIFAFEPQNRDQGRARDELIDLYRELGRFVCSRSTEVS
jgi:chromosome partitioning protein